MKYNRRLSPWPDVPKPAFTRNSKVYEYMLSIESDRVSFPRPIPHTSAVLHVLRGRNSCSFFSGGVQNTFYMK